MYGVPSMRLTLDYTTHFLASRYTMGRQPLDVANGIIDGFLFKQQSHDVGPAETRG